MDRAAAQRLADAIRQVAGYRVLALERTAGGHAYAITVQDRITSLTYTVTSADSWDQTRADCAAARREMARTNRVPTTSPTPTAVRTATPKDTPMTTVITETHADLPPPPRAGGRSFGESIRGLSDSLRAERARILQDRAETDNRLREIAAELAALDAAERVYRRKVDGAAVTPRPRALPPPPPVDAAQVARERGADNVSRRALALRQERERNGVEKPDRETRRHLLTEHLRTHDGELRVSDVARQVGVFPTAFNQEIRAMVAAGELVKLAAGHYRRT